MGETSTMMIMGLVICGAAGALVRDILGDNFLTLPKITQGKLFLGFLGSMVVGAAIGYLIDHSPITAFFAGYTGKSMFAKLAAKNESITLQI